MPTDGKKQTPFIGALTVNSDLVGALSEAPRETCLSGGEAIPWEII